MRPATSLGLLLALAAALSSASPASAQQYFSGIEPNQDKATATPAFGIGANDYLLLGGTLNGFAAPPNVFRLRTEPLPIDLYRYELRTFSTWTPSTLLGRTATVDQVAAQSTVALQATTYIGSPSQYLSWYGFGKSDEVFVDFNVAGSGRMFSATMELVASSVSERDLGAVPAGANLLRARVVPGSPTAHDLELFVFDAEFNALPYGANDESALSVEGPALAFDAPPGLYHIAVCDHAAATHLPPDAHDLRMTADVLDFAGALVCGSTDVDFDVELLVEGPGGGPPLASRTATKLLAYEALWFRLQVGVGQSLASYCAGDGSGGTCGCLGRSPPQSGMGCVNSTGRGATVIATDHVAGAGGAWRVTFEDLPPMTLALGFVGLQPAPPLQLLGGSSCVAPGAARTAVASADAAGTAVLAAFQPTALGFMAGQTLYLQGAYRDAVAQPGCQVNFTNGYSFVVR